MKLHHKESVFLPLDIKTENPLFQSPELRRSKLQMEEVNFDSSEEKVFRKGKFTRAVRAVLFHIKLKRRRNQEKRIVSDTMRRSSSGFSFSFRFRKQNSDENESNTDSTKSASTRSASLSISTSSSSSSSARVSFQSSESRISVSSGIHQNLEKQSSLKEELQRQSKRSGASIRIGFVLILMSLGVTILWGRVWAIAFNAIWLACIPQKLNLSLTKVEFGSDDDDEVEKVEESVKDARRRVIMEGLLDRKHHRHHHHQSLQQQKLS